MGCGPTLGHLGVDASGFPLDLPLTAFFPPFRSALKYLFLGELLLNTAVNMFHHLPLSLFHIMLYYLFIKIFFLCLYLPVPLNVGSVHGVTYG